MLQRSVLARMAVMGLLLLVLMVPLAMTRGIIAERTARRDQVAAEISRTWGDRQVITGPVLSVPYRYVVREAAGADRVGREVVRTGRLVLLPATLEASGRLDPEVRSRGPFSTVVYTSRLSLRGRFAPADTSLVARPDGTFAWDDATVSLGVADPRGIATGLRVAWNGRNGVARKGFEARWQSGWFARGFPAAWVRGQDDDRTIRARADASAIGVDLVQPIDVYQQAERAVKYAALFIVLTLAVAFVREVTSRRPVHPVQYLFIGFGLCLFYLLLVSLAEHLRFGLAYLIASASTVLLLSWYWSGVLRGWRPGLSMGVALTTLYGYLYLLLRLEDLALVAGATGLFVMLAVIMAMTRRVDWFALRIGVRMAERES